MGNPVVNDHQSIFQNKEQKDLVSIIQCYVSTNDGSKNDKDQFYERLHSILWKCPTDNHDGESKHQVQDGQHQVRTHNAAVWTRRKETGIVRLVRLCEFNKIVIGGNIFPYKYMQKTKLVSPDYTTENQIDQIVAIKTLSRFFEDVRTKK